ncbi:MAG: alanine racemase, partial [bacterium]
GLLRDDEGLAVEILRILGIDLGKIKRAMEDAVKSTGQIVSGNVPFTKRAEKILKMSYVEAEMCKADVIGTEHLLLALVKEKNGLASEMLRSFGVTYEAVLRKLKNLSGGTSFSKKANSSGEIDWNAILGESEESTSALDLLNRTLAEIPYVIARKGEQDPIIGHESAFYNLKHARSNPELLRPTVAKINLGAISKNIKHICQRVQPVEVMAVVKADGYGHGAIPVAQTVLSAGASQLGVALLEEGIELRRAKIEAPILVFGGFFESQIDRFIANDLQFTLYDLRLAQTVSRRGQALGRTAQAHVKIDTGMGRVGLLPNEAVEAILAMAKLPNLELVGLCTHFASSDSRDKSYANQQLEQFKS